MTSYDLLVLARIYLAATGVSRSQLGQISCGNRMIYFRLERGLGCHSASLEKAHAWFAAHWDNTGIPWPAEIPKPRPHRGLRDGMAMTDVAGDVR